MLEFHLRVNEGKDKGGRGQRVWTGRKQAESGMKKKNNEDKERKRKEKEKVTSHQRLLGSEVRSLVVGQPL